MNRLWTIVRKELIHIFRDTRTLALIIVLPAFLLLLLGYGVSGEQKNIPMVVADLSKTDLSRRYIDYYTSSGDFMVAYDALNEAEILKMIDTDLAQVGLLIPENFGREISTGGEAAVQIYYNASDPDISQKTNLTIGAISQIAAQDVLWEQLSKAGVGANITMPISTHSIALYNPDNERGLFMIPGLIPVILQLQALLLTTLAIVREREQGTMEQLIVTPIKSWELMLGKILPYLVVGLINTVAVLFIGAFIFDVAIVGSVWQFIGVSLIFIIGSLGMGVLISNVSQTQMQAMYLAVGIVLIPSIILSGLIFSRSGMPWFTYWISELLPVSHYLEITRGIMLKGVGIDVLMPSVWPLIILSVVYFVASVLLFRKRID
ncbi:MAG TPA: ABC transporter permease [Chloroflexi bacterium]|nr:ABC transporter permease [Chloroflexota bacterium]